MRTDDSRLRLLSPRHRRALKKYERLLGAAALNPDLVLDFADSDPVIVKALLINMTDQVVRSEVILEYTMIDMELDFVLYHHFFGKNLPRARRTRRYRTLRLMLQKCYPLDKLAFVRSFMQVPKAVASTIAAVNELRNGLAHNFFLYHLSPSKRSYKGLNIFTAKGLDVFRRDTSEVRKFLNPETYRLMGKLSFASTRSGP